MLKGADVVAYFTEGRFAQGRPEFSSRHEGVSFRFASAEHKALFDKVPAKYLPGSAATAPTASPTASPGAATPIPGR
jgi:YHS domain-containing protein